MGVVSVHSPHTVLSSTTVETREASSRYRQILRCRGRSTPCSTRLRRINSAENLSTLWQRVCTTDDKTLDRTPRGSGGEEAAQERGACGAVAEPDVRWSAGAERSAGALYWESCQGCSSRSIHTSERRDPNELSASNCARRNCSAGIPREETRPSSTRRFSRSAA